ncbi:MAG TPA: hypothetical protein VML55_20940 [Planctomycetaceae bacterium]|nr:hypothetical protein [Planctomycetaceae bacterium]
MTAQASRTSVRGQVVAAALALAFALYFVVPAAEEARELARLTPCRNVLFQHSGSHPCDLVSVDRDWRVVNVSSCPLCSNPDAPLAFFAVGEDGDCEWIGTEVEVDVPDAVVSEARQRLEIYKRWPDYQRAREHYSAPSYEKFREQLLSHLLSRRSMDSGNGAGQE